MPLYFAYGSNMDRAAMAVRCPGATALGPARLVRHRFIVTADGYATVLRDPHRAAWGLLWNLALADIPALDRYESLATGLYTKSVQPVLAAAGPRRALVYLARSSRPGAPKAGYVEGVVAAAAAAGLPEPYRRELETWLPNPPPGAVEKLAVRPLFSAPSGLRGRPRT
jgi:AIG2-like family